MPRPFAPPGTKTHFLPDRPLRVTHARIELDLDLTRRRLGGRTTLRLSSRRDPLTAVELDAVEMEIAGVRLDGEAARFWYDGEKLRVRCPRPLPRGTSFSLEVEYSCSPRRGLYFMGPDEAHPDRPPQCWTQGQDDDSRHYWPCVDAPFEKATTEVLCTAPAGNFVLSNGDLRDRTELPPGPDGVARVRWHYALDLPHPPYLVTLVCGPFVELRDGTKRTAVDVSYFVAPGREEDARRSFGRTPEMIDVFSEKIGVPYPHGRYSQIAVPEFIFGGMENTTATTLTDLALMDERAALDHDVEALVSHELAHQWWGDLLTCREWSEAWLNEGFATYFEYVWREHAHGRDEADMELRADTEGYLHEAGRYQRPIVCREYEEPIHLFDGHLYQKGGRVLHMLRHELGDEMFWQSLRHYAEQHARGSVETRDLLRAVEEVSGRGVAEFFDRWIARPGHPELECAWSWDDERKVGTLRVDQKQPITPDAPVFRFSTLVRVELDGAERDEPVTITEPTHVFELRLPSEPTQVIFDPGDVVLKTIKMQKSRPLWQRQLESARLAVDRMLAVDGLAAMVEPASVKALAKALEHDPFWGVRAAAARALGRMRRQDALEVLLAAVGQPHPKVRRAVATGLGEMRGDERAAASLARWAENGDPSYFVEAEAAIALGKTRSPRAIEVLPGLLSRRSFQDIIRSRAIEGLGACGDPRALAIIKSQYRPESSFLARRAVVMAMAELARGTPQAREAREAVETALADPDFRVRGEAASSLARIGDIDAYHAIERALTAELDGRAKRRMNDALRDLREAGHAPEQVKKLEEEIERLRGETTQLRERLDKLEARATGEAPPPAPPRGKPPAGKPKRPRPTTRRFQTARRPVRRR